MALITQTGSSYCIRNEMFQNKTGQNVVFSRASNIEVSNLKDNCIGFSSLSCNSARKTQILHTDNAGVGQKRRHSVVVAASPPTEDAVIATEPLTKEDLVAYLASGCKPKEAWRIGTEHEKFGFELKSLRPVKYEQISELLNGIAERFDWEKVMEGDYIIGLKQGKQSISLEPGGQFELSGAPLETLHQTCAEVNSHLYQVKAGTIQCFLKCRRTAEYTMPGKIRTAQTVSLDIPAAEQPGLHNRWHPDVPTIGSIEPGETVKIECVDWTGGQIGNNDSAEDVRTVDLTKIHYLTGPFEIKGAEPGDLLVVNITDVQPFEDSPWGFTGIFDRRNGGGFLDEHYPKAAKAIWDFDGIYCTSRHIPGVRFAGLIHPGILGCAPSHEVLAEWNRREADLISACVHSHPEKVVAQPPLAVNAHAGQATGDLKAKIAREGARTIPGRPEHGGNVDINNISRGSTTYLPVHVPGAKFSVGDLHFSQGDGEISFCGAIEIAGTITIKFDLIKNGVQSRAIKSPVFRPGDVAPNFGPGRYLTFEGFSVDENGKQHFLDATVAYRQACLRAIEYLKQFGYSGEQIYLLLSCAPIKGSIAGIVDVPNVCTTLGIPMDIFDFDISVEAVPKKRDLGSCPISSV